MSVHVFAWGTLICGMGVWRCLSAVSVVPRIFFAKIQQNIKVPFEMYFTEKKIKYADLVVPFMKCPFKIVEHDCPFKEYWQLASIEEQVQAIEDLPEKELDLLREHHKLCLERKMKNAKSRVKLRSVIGIFNNDLVFDDLQSVNL